MRYSTVITKQFETQRRPVYPQSRADLRPNAYVALTRKLGFGRENSHG